MGITVEEYAAEMSRLETEFPSLELTPARSEMIFDKAKDYSRETIRKVINHFIATHQPTKPPLVSDFYEALKHEQRDVSMEFTQPQLTSACQKCLDLGIVQVYTRDAVTLLAKCDCKEGKQRSEQLPILEMLEVRMVEPIPPRWFKPERGDSFESLQKKASDWREKLRQAEERWKNYDLAE